MYASILLIQWMHGIGDNFFTLPAYHVVREAYPKATLTFLVAKQNAQIYQGFPGLNQVLTIDRQAYHGDSYKKMLSETIELIRTVRRGNYQLIIDFTSSGETGLLALVSGAVERWGMIKRERRRFRSLYYTRIYKSAENIHSADKYLELVKKGGLNPSVIKNQFQLPNKYIEKAGSLLEKFGITRKRPILFIQPFTSDPNKDWPLEKQIQVAEYYTKQGIQILFGGAPGERQRLREVEARFPVVAGKADLLTTAGLIKLSTVVLGGDSGPLHMAVALGKRVVMFMGPTSPVRYGPYQRPSWVLTPDEGIDTGRIALKTVIEAIDEGFTEVQGDENGIGNT